MISIEEAKALVERYRIQKIKADQEKIEKTLNLISDTIRKEAKQGRQSLYFQFPSDWSLGLQKACGDMVSKAIMDAGFEVEMRTEHRGTSMFRPDALYISWRVLE